jgi:perosamine synthetase
LKSKLKEKVIPVKRIFMPVNETLYLKEFSKPYPNAYEIYKQGICLPSSTLNEEEEMRKAAINLKGILEVN